MPLPEPTIDEWGFLKTADNSLYVGLSEVYACIRDGLKVTFYFGVTYYTLTQTLEDDAISLVEWFMAVKRVGALYE